MAKILKADYETVTAVCDHCGVECIFNRREDFPNVGPYAGQNAICIHCRSDFRIIGDTINTAYELFIFSAREAFEQKRYMLTISNLAQAWELFILYKARHAFQVRSYEELRAGLI